MNDLAEYFSDKDRIKELKAYIVKLKASLACHVADKHKAIRSRNKLIKDKLRTVNTVAKLQISGNLIIDDGELADILFVTKKSLTCARQRIIKAVA